MKDSDKKAISQYPESAAQSLPLKGKTIVLTRPKTQSRQIAEMIERLGGKALHCPTIEIAEPESWAAVDETIEKIGSYHWIIFTSANGPEFFFKRLADRGKDAQSSIKGLIVCAIGPATAKAIERFGVKVDVVATDSKAEGALGAIIEYAGGIDKLDGLRMLIPRARVAREVLPAELARMGVSVDAVETYQTIRPDLDRASIIRLFTETKIDAITFTSSSTVSNFAALVGPENLASLLQGVLIACIGPVTAQTAAEYELKNIAQPASYNSEALVETIVRSIGN